MYAVEMYSHREVNHEEIDRALARLRLGSNFSVSAIAEDNFTHFLNIDVELKA